MTRTFVERLERGLTEALPAHETMSGPPEGDAPTWDLTWIQGRGDRLHLIVFAHAHDALDAALARALDAPGNWFWLAYDADAAPDTAARFDALAARHGFGVLRVGATSVTRTSLPAPKPGIHIRQHPALRKRWRAVSSF